MSIQRVLVTGGNQGIGFALCKQLAVDHGCHVYLGSRNAEKGAAAVKSIMDAAPKANVECIQIDCDSEDSIRKAAAQLKDAGVTLYGLVNNAGIGFQTGDGSVQRILNTNFYGVIRVSEAFHPLIDPKEGRIINVSSGAASGWLKKQSAQWKKIMSDPNVTMHQIEEVIQQAQETNKVTMGGYGLSKAALTAYTMVQAKEWPNLQCYSLSPGFIQTQMTNGFGARLTPEEGTVSIRRCLFEDKSKLTSGFYYGSDGLRSPMTMTRDPGTPEYEGEDNPEYAKYNK